MGYPASSRNAYLDGQITGAQWIALWTTAPDDEGAGGVEVSEASYARISHAAWNAAVAGHRTNNGEIDFGDPLTDWGTIVAISAMSLVTGGVQRAVTADISQVIQASANSVKILSGALDFKFTTL